MEEEIVKVEESRPEDWNAKEISFLFKGMGAATGSVFFQEMVRLFGESAGPSACWMGRLHLSGGGHRLRLPVRARTQTGAARKQAQAGAQGEGKDPLPEASVETLAFFREGELQENWSYPLRDYPCSLLLEAPEPLLWRGDLAARFPRAAFLQEFPAKVFLGALLRGEKGDPLGIFSLLGLEASAEFDSLGKVLKVFSERMAGELRRVLLEEELAQFQVKLEERVAERTRELQEVNARLAAESSQRAAVQRELAQSLSLLQAVFESSKEGFLIVEGDGRIVSFNSTFLKLWGIPRSVIQARDDRTAIQFVLPQLKDPEGFVAKVEKLYQAPEAESYDLLEMKDGRTFERYSTPQRVGREIMGRLWCFRDITDRRRAEEIALEQKALERSNRELRSFAWTISHEFREPLRKIQIAAERLGADPLSSRGREWLQKIQLSASRASQLVQDLLSLSEVRLEPPSWQPVSLKSVVEEVLREKEELIASQKAQVQVGDLPVVEGDRVQLQLLFHNLIANALKFHKPGKPPTVRIESCRVQVDGRDFCEVQVKDRGIGFDPKHAEKIFQPFQRLQSRAAFAGSGVGLSICAQVVANHGGRISAKSSGRGGAAFTVSLPLKSSSGGVYGSEKTY